MISQFFILSNRGDTIINKDCNYNYKIKVRGDLVKNTPEIFFRNFQINTQQINPIFNVDGINFAFIRKSSLILVCTSRFNVQPSFMMEVLARLCKLIKDFCGILNEESIRKNFTLIYEVLDEFIDFGFPQFTSTEQIKPFIVNDVQSQINLNSAFNIFNNNSTASSLETQKPINLKDEKKAKNEIFVDVYEKIYMLFNKSGYVINSGVTGCIQMKSYLHQNPQLRLALNDDLIIGNSKQVNLSNAKIDDCNFHESVNTTEFDINRTLKINPPDGEFTVMNYRIQGDFNEPFRVQPFLDESNPYKLELNLSIKSQFEKQIIASYLNVSFKVPKNIQSVHNELQKDKTIEQSADYEESSRTVHWKIKKMAGQCEYTLKSKIVLINHSLASKKQLGPINLQFEIPMFNISNIKINSLKVDDKQKSANPNKWIRYITQSTSYCCRT